MYANMHHFGFFFNRKPFFKGVRPAKELFFDAFFCCFSKNEGLSEGLLEA